MQYAPTVRVPSCAILFIPLIALRTITSRTYTRRLRVWLLSPRLTAQSSAMLSIRRVVPICAAMTSRAPASAMAGGCIVSAFTTLA